MAATKKPSTRKTKPKAKPAVAKTRPVVIPANQPKPELPSVWRLTQQAATVLWQYKRLFAGIAIVYGLLNVVLVQGFASNGDVSTVKSQVVSGNIDKLLTGLTGFTQLVGSSGSGASATGGVYQTVLVLITSLAIIWALRQVHAGAVVRVRDAFYRGAYPLVPFVLVLCAVALQLLPLIIGTSLYGLVISNGIAVSVLEKLLFALLAILLALVSLYLVSSSLFGLYIVTLPDMTPMKALRSARELVCHRRWTVLRKILSLPVILLVVAAVVMAPFILLLTPLAQAALFIVTTVALVAAHSYMYSLYRELL